MTHASESERPSIERIFQDILGEIGRERDNDIQIAGQDPTVPSPHRIGDATGVALATLATTLKTIWKLRTGIEDAATIDIKDTTAQLMAVYLTTVNGVSCTQLLPDPSMFLLSDFYQCKNDRWVFLLSTYPSLRDLNCKVLDCRFDRTELSKAASQWDAFELEEAISGQGGTCVVVRSLEEWIASPQGSLLVDTPVISIEKLSDGPPVPLPDLSEDQKSKTLPLHGIKVLDNTHVIAGPMCSRITAEYGAQVLSIARPQNMDPQAMTVETAIGKRSAWCDLSKPQSADQFWNVLKDADVYVCSYLSLDQRGFGPEALCKHRPGLVYVDFHCWGKTGPWVNRGGFDQLACSASGFSKTEGQSQGRPSLPPTHLLNDYLAALLGAAGTVEALHRRATQGGSWRVHINLSRICMWVQSMGFVPESEYNTIAKPKAEILRQSADLELVHGPFGATRYLPTQLSFSHSIRAHFQAGAEPTGVSDLKWV